MMFTIAAILLISIGIFFLKDNGSLTNSKYKRLLAVLAMLAGLICVILEYGELRGTIVFLALVSLLGTLAPFIASSKKRHGSH